MGQVTVNIPMDEDLKINFERLCTNAGLSIVSVFNAIAKSAASRDELPHDAYSMYTKPNAETLAAMEECEFMMKNPSLYKTYTDVDEMFREILEEDDD
ncbi:MAG: type II toxin-antitoxin system RelB/DinJ family antitoxin [Turicibacter sp.]|nr:type II toxin-antitoxin system RelB/DinJ family antitoxin [Turicibacter sp.]